MIVGVKILPKTEVLDSQGRAVQRTLSHSGKKIEACRVGKYVTLDFKTTSQEEAFKQAREIAEDILYNPLIESYELEVVK